MPLSCYLKVDYKSAVTSLLDKLEIFDIFIQGK